MGIILQGANVVGYVKCRRDAGAKITQMAGQFIGKQILKQVCMCMCVCGACLRVCVCACVRVCLACVSLKEQSSAICIHSFYANESTPAFVMTWFIYPLHLTVCGTSLERTRNFLNILQVYLFY